MRVVVADDIDAKFVEPRQLFRGHPEVENGLVTFPRLQRGQQSEQEWEIFGVASRYQAIIRRKIISSPAPNVRVQLVANHPILENSIAQ